MPTPDRSSAAARPGVLRPLRGCVSRSGFAPAWEGHDNLEYRLPRPVPALSATPREVYDGHRPANRRPRFEPRARYPGDGACAAPRVAARARPGAELRLVVSRLDGAEHLPVVEIKRAA